MKKLRVRVKIGLLQKTTLLGKAGILSRVLRLYVPGECPNGPLVIFPELCLFLNLMMRRTQIIINLYLYCQTSTFVLISFYFDIIYYFV